MTDVLIVNPPSPDGHIYIRDTCRWGRKSREKMIWPQSSMAYLAAMVPDEMNVRIIDAIAEEMPEDPLALFGFLTPQEQSLFELLIGVAGVGPRLAINILSGIEAPELLQALASGDVARRTRTPGVGKKTAERLVLELRERAGKLAITAGTPTPPEGPSALKEDLVSALANLGYGRAEADKAVERTLRDGSSERFEDLLRRALRVLSGRP